MKRLFALLAVAGVMASHHIEARQENGEKTSCGRCHQPRQRCGCGDTCEREVTKVEHKRAHEECTKSCSKQCPAGYKLVSKDKKHKEPKKKDSKKKSKSKKNKKSEANDLD